MQIGQGFNNQVYKANTPAYKANTKNLNNTPKSAPPISFGMAGKAAQQAQKPSSGLWGKLKQRMDNHREFVKRNVEEAEADRKLSQERAKRGEIFIATA